MNGWANWETWWVALHYARDMPDYYAEMEVFEVDGSQVHDDVRFIALEHELLHNLADDSFIGAFVNNAFCAVDWNEIAESINETLKEFERETP